MKTCVGARACTFGNWRVKVWNCCYKTKASCVAYQHHGPSEFSLGLIEGFSFAVLGVKCRYEPMRSEFLFRGVYHYCDLLRWNLFPTHYHVGSSLFLSLSFRNDLGSKLEHDASEFTPCLLLEPWERLQQIKTHFPELFSAHNKEIEKFHQTALLSLTKDEWIIILVVVSNTSNQH